MFEKKIFKKVLCSNKIMFDNPKKKNVGEILIIIGKYNILPRTCIVHRKKFNLNLYCIAKSTEFTTLHNFYSKL